MRNQHRWTQLRCDGISPEDAFEELCSQISRNSAPVGAKQFIRNGTPDGGIEFYWILENNTISGWQCKFFQGPLTKGQWIQLDKSFADALKNYPEMTNFVVALPQDMAQGREKGKKSFRQKWEERITKWSAEAQSQGRTVRIDFFGNAEIFNFLDVHDQSGRRWYWFEQTALTQQWFELRLTEAIANAGVRYTPELNIQVPLTRTLEFLSRSEYYRNILLTHLGLIRRSSRQVLSVPCDERMSMQNFSQLSSTLQSLEEILSKASDREMPKVPWQEIRNQCSQILNSIHEVLDELGKRQGRTKDSQSKWQNLPESIRVTDYNFKQLESTIYTLIRDLDEISEEVTNVKALLITGNAGSGKTHMLCDYATACVRMGAPAVLLYGEHFHDGEPWNQICRLLHLGELGADRFLQALESAGQSRQARALIIIDGINEGAGRVIWRKHLRGMLAVLSNYNWIGLVISLRSGFEAYITDEENLESLKIVRRCHQGFADLEFDALPEFCRHYGLSMPSVPILLTEFQNPLFLKLTCESMKSSKNKELKQGRFGLNTTFESYVYEVNRKLSERLSFDPRDNLVKQSLVALSQALAKSKESSLPYAAAKAIVNRIHSSEIFDRSLFSQLISEGVLKETFRYKKDSSKEEHIRFSYERHGDHLMAAYLLEQFTDLEQLKDAFGAGELLGEICAKSYKNRGLLEALSIQIPEKYGKELVTILPPHLDVFPFAEILIAGLSWRKSTSIDTACVELCLEFANKQEHLREKFLETLVTLCAIPSHPLNADLLNRLLIELPMPQRDYFWTRFISDSFFYGRQTAVGRLVDWLSSHKSESLSDESVRLYGKALTWMLCSPNRILRDRATKSLVRLLEEKIFVLAELLEEFSNIDDAYISERLYAIAYGCALRTGDMKALKVLGDLIFAKQFKTGTPDTNILLRDYARGVIEVCVNSMVAPTDWLQKANPPYKDCPLPVFPSQDFVEKFKAETYGILYASIMGDSDFAENVISSNLAARWLTKESRDSRREQKGANRWNRHGQICWHGPQRWILNRIVELGWQEKLFIEFDNDQFRRSSGRYDNKLEGFDTKYAWIALYEILAHLQDSADFNYDDPDEEECSYVGPWQFSYIRNIDVSRLEPVRGTKLPEYLKKLPKQPEYDSWYRPVAERDWIEQTADLPNPPKILSSEDWLILGGKFIWEEPTAPGDNRYDIPRRSFWYTIQAYFVNSGEADLLSSWLTQQDVLTKILPEPPYSYNIFLGEFFRTLAFKYHNCSYYNREDWTRDHNERLPAKVLVATDGYLNESGVYDHSFDESVFFRLPCKWLVSQLGLSWNGEAGFTNRKGDLIAFDPMYWNQAPSRLAIERSTLREFLKEEKLEVIWSIRGRKCVLGESRGKDSPGQLEIQSVCRITEGEFTGSTNFIHIKPDGNYRKLDGQNF